ncbi:MAG: hypothetical protein JNM36_04685 [Chitinophagales bacterium]|nr:hypothetical protein [Chitinophagales bacterium]
MKTIFVSLFFCLITVQLCVAQNWTGVYTGFQYGMSIEVQLQQKGSELTGVYRDSGNPSSLNGTIENATTAQGTMMSEGMEVATFVAVLNGAALNMQINLLGLLPVTFELTKSSEQSTTKNDASASSSGMSASSSTAGGRGDKHSRDGQLLGAWVRESIINSGGYGNMASFSTAYYLNFYADGSCTEESESAGGGGDWSYSGGGRSMDFRGFWYSENGNLYVKQNATDNYVLYAKYQFYDGNLVLTNTQGKRDIYHR